MVNGDGFFDWQILVLLGCMSGFLSGLLGIGGGLILVPGLIVSLPYFGVEGPDLPKIAMATSLALIVPTSLASVQTHALKGAVDPRLFALLGPGIFAGAAAAPILAPKISSTVLIALFVLFALYTALGLMRASASAPRSSDVPGLARITLTGLAGGSVSSVLGLGVSWFTMPILERFGSVPRAIGTSAALCLPMAAFGITGFLLSPTPAECEWGCNGYVYLPAVAATGISAVLAAPMGARLTHVLPARTLRTLFAAFLIIAAANLTYKNLAVASATNEARILIANLLAPDPDSIPIAAQAPGWLDVSRRDAQLALVARHDPRHAFSGDTEPAPRAELVLNRIAPPPEDAIAAWYRARILKARANRQHRDNNAVPAIPLPERAIRPKRRTARAKVEQQAERSPAPIQPMLLDPFGFLTVPGSGSRPLSWSK
jgi:uncharacterized membrane protein YfcA